MKEKVEKTPWTVMKSEEKEDMTMEHHPVVTRNDMVSYEYRIQIIAQTGK